VVEVRLDHALPHQLLADAVVRPLVHLGRTPADASPHMRRCELQAC
jgi:hypothetical protein